MRRRLLSIALGVVLVMGPMACTDDESPDTTAPIGDTTTSAPVGS